jgi:hypothetical protein
MSLNQVEAEVEVRENPVDVVEQMASSNEWVFDREDEDEISISVKGRWTDYHIAFTWLPDVEALHLACAFDLKPPARRRPELLNLLAMVNEQLWIGHFGLWEAEKVMIYRHSLLLAGGARPNRRQCEAALESAVHSCERYFQAFQFVIWAGKAAGEALACVLFETVGEA